MTADSCARVPVPSPVASAHVRPASRDVDHPFHPVTRSLFHNGSIRRKWHRRCGQSSPVRLGRSRRRLWSPEQQSGGSRSPVPVQSQCVGAAGIGIILFFVLLLVRNPVRRRRRSGVVVVVRGQSPLTVLVTGCPRRTVSSLIWSQSPQQPQQRQQQRRQQPQQ